MKSVSFYLFSPTFIFVLLKLSGHVDLLRSSMVPQKPPLLLPEVHFRKTLSRLTCALVIHRYLRWKLDPSEGGGDVSGSAPFGLFWVGGGKRRWGERVRKWGVMMEP